MANKKRTPPDFSWMSSYQPKEVDPAVVEAELADAITENHQDGGGSLPTSESVTSSQKDSLLSSPDVTVHRSSIATGA